MGSYKKRTKEIMKSIYKFILEKLKLNNQSKLKSKEQNLDPRKKETYGDFGERWFDMCRNLSISGSFAYTSPKLHLYDFANYLDDFDKNFKPDSGDSLWAEMCRTRYKIGQLIRKGKIKEAADMAYNENIESFTYGAHPASYRVYGSYMLDCYMIFATYEYMTNGATTVRNNILQGIFNLDNQFDWYKRFEKFVNTYKVK